MMRTRSAVLGACILILGGSRAVPADKTAPGLIRDLSAAPGARDGEAILRFTAPGNDDYSPLRPLNGKYHVRLEPAATGGASRGGRQTFAIKDVNYGHPERVTIALLGDTQFGFPKGDPTPAIEAVRPTMADLTDIEHDFLAVLGDLVQTDRYWDLHHKELEVKSPRPLYLIGGNAETYYGIEKFVSHTGFSAHGYRVYVRGIRFIFLTVTATSGRTAHICHVGPRQMAWLSKELDRDRSASTAVFFHAPLLDTTTGSTREREMHMHESDEMRRLFAAHPNVVLFANGHLHRGYGPTGGPRKGGPYFVEGNVLHVSVGRPPHTCVVEWAKDGLTVRVRDNRTRAWRPGWGVAHLVPITLKPKSLDAQTISVKDLEPGQRYAFTAWTEDEAGNTSQPSRAASATARRLPQAPPSKPTDLVVGMREGADKVTFAARYHDVNVRDVATRCQIEVEQSLERVVDDFDDGDHVRWSFTNVKDVGESDGVLSGTSSSRDPQMVAPLEPPVDGSVYGSIQLRLRVVGNPRAAELFWANEDRGICGEHRQSIGPADDGRMHTYEVVVADHRHWRGKTISSLRLDPTACDGQRFMVDHIVLRSTPGRGRTVWRSAELALPLVKNGQVVPPLTYAGPALVRNGSHYWRIRFWDDHGAAGQWSDWVLLRR